jgi:alpha-D-ribose 1-methylphosphonate 5-triphosphate synthase subunit PhnG
MAKTIWAEARQEDTVKKLAADWLFNYMHRYLERNGQKAAVKKTSNVDFCTMLFGEI